MEQLIERIKLECRHGHQLVSHLDLMLHLLFALLLVPCIELSIEERIVQIDRRKVDLHLCIVE